MDSVGGQSGTSNPLVGGITQNVVGSLMQKFGLSNGAASGIASSLIPVVLAKLANKTNDPNDNSFTPQGLMGALTGGSNPGGGLSDLIGGVLGK